MAKRGFENPWVRPIPLAEGYVQFLARGSMVHPVVLPQEEDAPPETASDAHLRFFGVTLPAFVEQPVVSATVFVDAAQQDGIEPARRNPAGLVFVLQSISIAPRDDNTRIIVSAVWDRHHQGVSMADRRALSQCSVSCHLVVTGKPGSIRVTKGDASKIRIDGSRQEAEAFSEPRTPAQAGNEVATSEITARRTEPKDLN